MGRVKQLQVIETAFNRYELLDVIGEGDAGRVWRATDSTGLNVAIKMLTAERATTERRKRFQNEILFCQRVRHQNVVAVLDYGVMASTATSAPFYVMTTA